MKETFYLTKEHIKLLSNMFVDWNFIENGAPHIDPKRPYGNKDILGDMSDILNIKTVKCPNCEEIIDKDMTNSLFDLHKQTKTALQIILCTKSFRTGLYKKQDAYDNRSWEYCGEFKVGVKTTTI